EIAVDLPSPPGCRYLLATSSGGMTGNDLTTGEQVYSNLTVTLSAIPLASITVTRANPGPSGVKNIVRVVLALPSGMPLISTISGPVPPEIFSASGSMPPSGREV